MGKNVAVFVDVANIFYAAKAAGVDIDYVTLLKASSAGRDLVRAYAYTGLDPDNENQRNFHDFLRRHGYRVVSKDIRKYGDGKVKANLDIELVVDMMKTARNLDVAIVVSGDGDFAPAIRAVQEQGVRVEVVSFRGNTSSDLMDVADLFTDITQIAKVEKGSSRSGRRVATDDEDLSMTEVPDKQSEGTGERSRGRGRTRRTTVATTTSGAARGRGRVAAAAATGEGTLVALPGEKLSRAASAAASAAEPEDGDLEEAVAELDAGEAIGVDQGENGASEDGPRRRRRRGGRGRGRGRGREEGAAVEGEDRVAASGEAEGNEDEAPTPAPARRPASTFGSVWDSQIGISATRGAPLVDDDEDLEEPAVPEYLLAERRQRDAAGRGNRGGRGRGGAYAAALDRERFGGGRGSTPSRFAEPPPRREGAFGRPAGERDRDRASAVTGIAVIDSRSASRSDQPLGRPVTSPGARSRRRSRRCSERSSARARPPGPSRSRPVPLRSSRWPARRQRPRPADQDLPAAPRRARDDRAREPMLPSALRQGPKRPRRPPRRSLSRVGRGEAPPAARPARRPRHRPRRRPRRSAPRPGRPRPPGRGRRLRRRRPATTPPGRPTPSHRTPPRWRRPSVGPLVGRRSQRPDPGTHPGQPGRAWPAGR